MPSGANTRSMSNGPDLICTKSLPLIMSSSSLTSTLNFRSFICGNDSPPILLIFAGIDLYVLCGARVPQQYRPALADKHVIDGVPRKGRGDLLGLRRTELITRHLVSVVAVW